MDTYHIYIIEEYKEASVRHSSWEADTDGMGISYLYYELTRQLFNYPNYNLNFKVLTF